jgi:hypothetical protein
METLVREHLNRFVKSEVGVDLLSGEILLENVSLREDTIRDLLPRALAKRLGVKKNNFFSKIYL